MTVKDIKKLWERLADIPVDDNDCIDVDFHIWKKGTSKFDIWHWFDDIYEPGVHALMFEKNGGGVNVGI